MRFTPQRRASFWLAMVVLAIVATSFVLSSPSSARTGVYKIAVLRASTNGNTTHAWDHAHIVAAANEMHGFFRDLSYGTLDVQFDVTEATANAHTADYYFEHCFDGGTCRANEGARDLAADAVANHFGLAGFDGIVVLNGYCSGDYTPFDHISVPGVSGSFTYSIDYECTTTASDPRTPPGPSRVWWSGWAHEIGHQLELADGIDLGGAWAGHPGGYSSGYNLMDSCYPCDESVYGKTTAPVMNGPKRVFPGYIPEGKVVRVDAPPSGSGGATVVLQPLELYPGTVPGPAAIKIPISGGLYYMVDARRRLNADTLNSGPGIWDEGVQIEKINESGDPPVQDIDSCDTVVPGGCVHSDSDSRKPNCNVANPLRVGDIPDYCWPYPLWHVGQAYNDTTNGIQIRVDSEVGNGFSVTVSRGPAIGRPDVYVLPWLTPPLNTWESNDIWVDSSCNGYAADVGAAGLRYGRRPDGSGIGNGDDPCVNHENRIYVRVHNGGDRVATNVVVKVNVTNPLGVGIRGSSGWTLVGTATQAQFPALSALDPGRSTDVYVPWTPRVPHLAAGEFAFHSCLQVTIDTVSGELVTSNQDGDGEQENIDNFEATRTPAHDFVVGEPHIFIRNIVGTKKAPQRRRTFFLDSVSRLPRGWSFRVGNGSDSYTLDPGQTRILPVTVKVPRGTRIGQSYRLAVTASTLDVLRNPAIPTTSPLPANHRTGLLVGGVILQAQTVDPSKLTVAARRTTGAVIGTGALAPPHRTFVAVDFTAGSATVTRLVRTDTAGKFVFALKLSAFPKGAPTKTIAVRAFWQGDKDHAAATSPTLSCRQGVCSR